METDRASYHHGDLRAALVKGARSLLEERGVEGLSLREVARRAGVSRTAPYHHFRNKEAMIAAVAEAGFAQLTAEMARIPDDIDPYEQLDACGRAYLAFAFANPTLYRLMFGTKIESFSDHPELENSARCSFGLLVERMARLGSNGDPTPRAMAVWAAVHGLASLIIDDLGPFDATEPDNVERWVAEAMELVGRGLGRPVSRDGT